MQQRLNYREKRWQNALKAMSGLSAYLAKSSLEKNLIHLAEFRVSQINGCAFCLDMHSKDLRAGGETEQRLYMLEAWRESSLYSERERAALAWTEAVTKITEGHVPDEVYEQAIRQFSEEELVDLTFVVNATNWYNRINIAFRTPAGDYQPGQFEVQPN
jgi:AhpD family alkylhydroperoxidase